MCTSQSIRLLMTGVLLCLSQPGRADMDCSAAGNSTEQPICSNPALLELDRQLNSIYRAALKATAKPDALKAEQRKWLKDERNRCQDHYCLQNAYAARIAQLDLLVPSSSRTAFPETPVGAAANLSQDQAVQVCSEVAQALDSGTVGRFRVEGVKYSAFEHPGLAPPLSEAEQELLYRSTTFREPFRIYGLTLQPGAGVTRFATFRVGGTCWSSQLANLDRLLATSGEDEDEGEDAVDDPEEEARWVYWGGGDDVIFLHGRYFRLTSGAATKMVSWIKPNGNIRRLCLLGTEQASRSVSAATDAALCAAVAGGRLPALKWEPAYDPQRTAFEAQFNSIVDSMELMQIDLDGDGRPDRIAKLTYDSGAGCGAHYEWLAHLTSNSGPPQQGRLESQLKEISGTPLNVYRYKAKYYIEGIREKVPGVFGVREGHTVQVCAFKINTHTTVKRTFYLPSE